MRQYSPHRLLTYRGVPLWRDVRILQGVAQVVSAIIVVSFVVFFIGNVLEAADRRGLALGFDFLGQEAGFPISESVIEYHEADSFLYAFLVGVLNTLKVALVGIVLATGLGIVVGVARLSPNWLLSKLAGVLVFWRISVVASGPKQPPLARSRLPQQSWHLYCLGHALVHFPGMAVVRPRGHFASRGLADCSDPPSSTNGAEHLLGSGACIGAAAFSDPWMAPDG